MNTKLRVSEAGVSSSAQCHVAARGRTRAGAPARIASGLCTVLVVLGTLAQVPASHSQSLDIVYTAETASGGLVDERLPAFRTRGWVCGRDYRGESASRLQAMDEALAALARLTPVLEILVEQANPEIGIEPTAIGDIAQRILDGGPFEARAFDSSAERRLLSRSKGLADDVLNGEQVRRNEIQRAVRLRGVRPSRESLSVELGLSTHVLDSCFSVEDLQTMLNTEKKRAEDLLEERGRYLSLKDRLLSAGKR